MDWWILSSAILMLIAGMMNGVMDTIKHRWWSSVFCDIQNERWKEYFHLYGWMNSYMDNDTKLGRRKWFGIIPVWKPLLDAWHAAKSIMLASISVAVMCAAMSSLEFTYMEIIYIFAGRLAFGIGFTIMYSWLLVKR